MKKAVCISLDENLLNTIKEYAEKWHLSVSATMAYFLTQGLEGREEK